MTTESRELFELCKQVYEATGWENDPYIKHLNKAPKYEHRYGNASIYTSDYLLEKLPEEIKKRVLVVTNGDRPHAGYAERDNYGNYTLDEYYWKNAQYSDEVRKALLKLTIALSEAGELK